MGTPGAGNTGAAPAAGGGGGGGGGGTLTGLAPNVEGLICYLFGAFSGVVFVAATPKNAPQRDFIVFNGWQSIILSLAYIPIAILFGILDAVINGFNFLSLLLFLFFYGFFIFLMYMAYTAPSRNWTPFKTPGIAGLIENSIMKVRSTQKIRKNLCRPLCRCRVWGVGRAVSGVLGAPWLRCWVLVLSKRGGGRGSRPPGLVGVTGWNRPTTDFG